MVMQIRPPNVWQDANTNAAVDFKVYISQPNTDPKDPSKQLSITDSASGEVVSNYFVINPSGYAKNQNGQPVLPIIQEQEYAILFESVGGGQQWAYPHVKGDAFGLTSGGSGSVMVDEVFNNFPAAQAADLTAFDLIFIQSKTAGWEGTANGPSYPYYAYYTGGVGSPGTGTFDLFYDSQGNEWKITENSQLPLTNEDGVATNANAISSLDDVTFKSKKVTVITASDPAWTPDSNALSMDVIAIGGGGGGGGIELAPVGESSAGSCGGGGGWCEFHLSSLSGTYNITVGAAGAGGSTTPTNGGDGGDTTVTGTSISLTAEGGKGGILGLSSAGSHAVAGVAGGGSSGGDLLGKGARSTDARWNSGLIAETSISGSSRMGGGVESFSMSLTPDPATVFGEGGASAYSSNGTPITDGGQPGFSGAVIITEYLK